MLILSVPGHNYTSKSDVYRHHILPYKDVYTSESVVYRCQILTCKDSPRYQRVNALTIQHVYFIQLIYSKYAMWYINMTNKFEGQSGIDKLFILFSLEDLKI